MRGATSTSRSASSAPRPVHADVRAVIDVLPAYGRRATLLAALAAMNPRRNPDGSLGFFAALGFGESVHLSAVYAALQDVPGVEKVAIRTLRMPRGIPATASATAFPCR